MTRRDIAFDAEGVTLRGWFYEAGGASGPGAAVVMAHGFSAVKEMYLDSFAEAFAAAGLNVLVFDNRCFGASDGEPRQEIEPWAQVRDYRHAITYLHTVPEVDPGRIGIWGSSYSGGHVLVVAAIDRRVKAVVSQVPRAVRRRPAGPLPGQGAGHGARGRQGPARSLGAADAGLVGVVLPDRGNPGADLAQRGDAAQRGDVHRVRAGRLPAVDQPHAAAAPGRRGRSPGAV